MRNLLDDDLDISASGPAFSLRRGESFSSPLLPRSGRATRDVQGVEAPKDYDRIAMLVFFGTLGLDRTSYPRAPKSKELLRRSFVLSLARV